MSEAKKLNSDQPWQLQVTESSAERGDARCIGIGEGLEPLRILSLATEQGFSHVCQTQGLDYDKEIRSTNNIISAPESFFAYPVATIFTPEDLSPAAEAARVVYDTNFNSSNQKRTVLESVTNTLVSKNIPQTMIDDVILVADELFTNAIYNAPFVDKVTHVNPGISRNLLEITLEEGKHGRLFLAQEDKRLVVGCIDPYGSLSIERYLGKMKATYALGAAATMNFGSGGAGLGSYIIFNTGCSLYVGVRPGHATVICCIFPLGMSNRKRATLPKHLHWIQL